MESDAIVPRTEMPPIDKVVADMNPMPDMDTNVFADPAGSELGETNVTAGIGF